MLEAGKKIPSFSLQQTDGSKVKSSDWEGKTVILYFYPEDGTPTCTTQACSLRDGFDKIKRTGVLVYGISPDSVDSHRRFTSKFKLPFPLLSDPGHKVAEKFGVWAEKTMFGRKYMGIKRTTFVIGPDGKIAHVVLKVNSSQHAMQIANLLT